MSDAIRKNVENFLKQKDIHVLGAASAEVLDKTAPIGFRPSEMLPGAKTVLIFGKPLPLAVFLTPKSYKNLFYVNTFSNYYGITDEAASGASMIMENAGFLSLPVPSYNPIRFYQGEPRGVLSLKHCAVEAGIGRMDKNTLLIHPEYGNILRFGGLITTMEWPCSGPREHKNLCPSKCHICVDACPKGAIKGDGTIDKIACMTNCISHTLLPPAKIMGRMKKLLTKSPKMTNLMELFTFNFFENYGIECMACLKACPRFPGHKFKTS